MRRPSFRCNTQFNNRRKIVFTTEFDYVYTHRGFSHQLHAGGITTIVFSYHDDIDERLAGVLPGVASHDCHDLGSNPLRMAEPGPVAHVESPGQLRDILAAIFADLGDLQLEQLRAALKQSHEAMGGGAGGPPRKRPGFRDYLRLLHAIEKPDKGTRTLLARLRELDDFGFFAAAEGGGRLLEGCTPRLIRIHAVGNEVVQGAYASFVLDRVDSDMLRRGWQERLTPAVLLDQAHKTDRCKLLTVLPGARV